jgi:hypothetical protein
VTVGSRQYYGHYFHMAMTCDHIGKSQCYLERNPPGHELGRLEKRSTFLYKLQLD